MKVMVQGYLQHPPKNQQRGGNLLNDTTVMGDFPEWLQQAQGSTVNNAKSLWTQIKGKYDYQNIRAFFSAVPINHKMTHEIKQV